jgi:hypothetical protein
MVTARAYEPDTEVVDVEDPPASPPRPRVRTEDLIMHVHLDDGWHRMASDGLETACGRPIDIRLQIETRPGRLPEHPLALCECWTTRERGKAGAAYEARWGTEYKPWGAKR